MDIDIRNFYGIHPQSLIIIHDNDILFSRHRNVREILLFFFSTCVITISSGNIVFNALFHCHSSRDNGVSKCITCPLA